jgi:hypothetical protein
MTFRICTIKDCDKPHRGKNLCNKHLQWLRKGREAELLAMGYEPDRQFKNPLKKPEPTVISPKLMQIFDSACNHLIKEPI